MLCIFLIWVDGFRDLNLTEVDVDNIIPYRG